MVTVYKRQTTTTKLKLGLLGTNLITIINRVRVNFLKVKLLLAVCAIYSLFAVSSKVVFLAAVFCSRLAAKTRQEKFRTAECVDTPNRYINRGVRRSHVFSLNQNDQMHRSRMESKTGNTVKDYSFTLCQTLYTLTSVSTFSILFSVQFLRY